METTKENIISLIHKDSLSQPKILLIEDCQCDTVLIKHILSEYYPYTLVDHAETKQEALQYLGRNKYDLILPPDGGDPTRVEVDYETLYFQMK